nr:MAG TPA: hypothetical protein [Caudoviricetes sp.]
MRTVQTIMITLVILHLLPYCKSLLINSLRNLKSR